MADFTEAQAALRIIATVDPLPWVRLELDRPVWRSLVCSWSVALGSGLRRPAVGSLKPQLVTSCRVVIVP